eukprot:7182349-Pyramimonas_sp.AAC.1
MFGTVCKNCTDFLLNAGGDGGGGGRAFSGGLPRRIPRGYHRRHSREPDAWPHWVWTWYYGALLLGQCARGAGPGSFGTTQPFVVPGVHDDGYGEH